MSSGREAVSAVQSRKVDVIAMDMQMPETDGLEATADIRRWERTTGTHIPIIAITAHAMKGDRERCLEAGMDGYTSKPIRIKALEQAIARLVPTDSVKVPAPSNDGAEEVIDHGALLEGFDGNRRGNQGRDSSPRCPCSGESSARTKRLGGKLRHQEWVCARTTS